MAMSKLKVVRIRFVLVSQEILTRRLLNLTENSKRQGKK
jgi:hypothetical protein